MSITEQESTNKVKINLDKIIDLFGDKIYNSDGSAFREQVVNALSHGCWAYHDEYGYTDKVFVTIEFDHLHRKVIVMDNGMGMTQDRFLNFFASFGNSFNESGARSGQHGLGAMSFLRLSSSTIVESKSRDTQEHFAFIIAEGKNIDPVNNRNLEDYGTRVEMTLKQDVRFRELEDVISQLGRAYPVKMIFRQTNTEVSHKSADSALDKYEAEEDQIHDEVKIYEAVRTLEDYATRLELEHPIRLETTDPNIELLIAEEKESHTLLCRVPIEIRRAMYELNDGMINEYDVFQKFRQEFGMIINILDERGDYKPEHHRDELAKKSGQKLIKVVNEAIEKFVGSIKVTTIEEYKNSEYNWILTKYGLDDFFAPETRHVVDYLRSTYKVRDRTGLHKSKMNLEDLLDRYDQIFYLPSLAKVTFDSFEQAPQFNNVNLAFARPWYEDEEESPYSQAFVNDFEDAREAKKRFKIRARTRTPQELSIVVHSLNGKEYVSLEEIEEDENIFFDSSEDINFTQLKKSIESANYWRYWSENRPVGTIGIVIAKKNVKKVQREKESIIDELQSIKQKERKVIHDGVLRKGKLGDLMRVSGTVTIYPTSLLELFKKAKLAGFEKCAFVTRDEFEIIALLDRPLSLNINAKYDDNVLDHLYLHGTPIPDRLRNNDGIKYIKKFPIDYEQRKVAYMVANTMLELTDYIDPKKRAKTIEVSTQFVKKLFAFKSHDELSKWLNKEKIIEYFAKFGLNAQRNHYNIDDYFKKIFRMLQTNEDILKEDTEEMKFDGFAIHDKKVTYFTRREEELYYLKNNVDSVLGSDVKVYPTIIDEHAVIAVTVPLSRRIARLKTEDGDD